MVHRRDFLRTAAAGAAGVYVTSRGGRDGWAAASGRRQVSSAAADR